MTAQRITPDELERVDGMPTLGLGTWQNEDPETCSESVRTALEMGYRHVDTAQIYGNEAAVGDGIAAANVPRDDVFLATKVWIDELAYDDVIHSTMESLDRLGTDYLDLLYVHWPARTYDPADTMAAFDELVDRGAVERVGVSNFEPEHVDRAQAELDAPLFANQVEMHPLLPQEHIQECTAKEGINLVAYSPLIRGKAFEVPELSEVAEKHDASEAQVCLAWLRAKGATPIPKATSEAHIRDNWESLALDLDESDVATIDGIDRTDRQVNPGFGPDAWD